MVTGKGDTNWFLLCSLSKIDYDNSIYCYFIEVPISSKESCVLGLSNMSLSTIIIIHMYYYTHVLYYCYTNVLYYYYTHVLYHYYTHVLYHYYTHVLYYYCTHVLYHYYTHVLYYYYTHVLYY